jgi:hypothetical protein
MSATSATRKPPGSFMETHIKCENLFPIFIKAFPALQGTVQGHLRVRQVLFDRFSPSSDSDPDDYAFLVDFDATIA